jgi:hypothetical protein
MVWQAKGKVVEFGIRPFFTRDDVSSYVCVSLSVQAEKSCMLVGLNYETCVHKWILVMSA